MVKINECQGYVYSNVIRFIIRWIIPLQAVFLCGFSLWLLYLAITYSENRSTHTLLFVVFLLSSLGMLIARKFSLQKLAWGYMCNNNRIVNYNKSKEFFVDTHLPLFVSRICFQTSKRIPLVEDYYILSNKPLEYIPNHEENGTLIVQKMMQNEVVVIPANESTQAVIIQLVGHVVIPTYPKVAYLANRR